MDELRYSVTIIQGKDPKYHETLKGCTRDEAKAWGRKQAQALGYPEAYVRVEELCI